MTTDGAVLRPQLKGGRGVATFFWVALGVSVAALAVSTIRDQPPLVVFGLGILPLVAYHVRLWFAVRSGLPQAAIDTVYYFGFLVTIATLAAAVLKLVLLRAATIDEIAFQSFGATFGLGLLATGYALFARIHLMTAGQRFAQEDLGEQVDRYAQEAGKAVATITRSATEFEAFSRTVRDAAQRSVQDSATAAQTAVAAVADAARVSLDAGLRDLSSSLTDVGRTLAATLTSDDLSAFQQGLRGINGSITALGNQLRRFSDKVASAEETLEQAASSISASLVGIGAVCSAMEQIGGMAQPIASLRSGVASLERDTASLREDVTKLSSEMRSMAASVAADRQGRANALAADLSASSQAQQITRNLGVAISDVEQRVNVLAKSADRLGESLEGLAVRAGSSWDKAYAGTDQVVAALSQLQEQLSRIATGLAVHSAPRSTDG
jgi:hypothetical protein